MRRAAESVRDLARNAERHAETVREGALARPVVSIAAAALVGTALGALVFRRAGKLLFYAAASFVVADLWKQEGGTDVRALLDRMIGEG